MKKNCIKLTLIFFAVCLAMLFFSSKVYAGRLNLDSLNYEAKLNKDGSMDVVETWDIDIRDTNTLFKTFNIDKTKYTEIKNVKVSEVTKNETKSFEKIDEYMYHVTKNCFYALENNDGKFEIAWGVNVDDDERKYKISYTVVDAIKTYTDCSELYWQFIGKDNNIPADKVTGTITLPSEATKKENIRAWAHGPLNGNISIDSLDTVTFEVSYLDPGTYVEIRLATLDNMFSQNLNVINNKHFNTILGEETVWANEANEYREKKIKEKEEQEKTIKIVITAILVVSAIISILPIRKAIKYTKTLKETKKLEPNTKVDYYRDIPNEKATPAECAFLYYFDASNTGVKTNLSKILSGTMLNLCIKRFIEFEVKEGKFNKKEISIKFIEGNNISALKEDESIIYELLKTIKGEQEKLEIKEIEKYAKKHSQKFLKELEKIPDAVQDEQEKEQNYSNEIRAKYTKWSGKGAAYLIGGIFLIWTVFLGIALIVCGAICLAISKKFTGLTQKGTDEQELWKGLKKYMLDFSMMKDKEVPEIVLWEKYLVFATVFGIADKVLKQLKIVYPQFTDSDYLTNTTYMYLLCHSNNMYLLNDFTNSIDKAYNEGVSARAVAEGYSYGNSSSGGGFGGGFSGGGGFGGGGGRNGRKINTRKTEHNEEKRSKIKEKLAKFASFFQ